MTLMSQTKDMLSLMKLRIDLFITLSGLVAAYATMKGPISVSHLFWLSAALMLASAGSALCNQVADRDIDGLMARTRNRALPLGRIQPGRVLALGGVLGLAGFGVGFWEFNTTVAIHLFLGAFVYAVVYTVWLKRRTWWNIVVGGLSGSFAMLAGGASVRTDLCLTPLFLALAMFFWTPSHFWSLAMARSADYAKAKIPMLPVIVGPARSARAIFLNTLLLFGASLLPYFFGTLGLVYLSGAILAGGYFLWENVRLIRNPSTEIAWVNFMASMIYLTLILVAVVIDVLI